MFNPTTTKNSNIGKTSLILLILLIPVLLCPYTPLTVLASTVDDLNPDTQSSTIGGGMDNTHSGTGSMIGGGSGDTPTIDNQNYRNFKSCLSNVEVNGVATGQQVKNCGATSFPNWNEN